MAETVEAIQVHLRGSAYILWPGSRENPPKDIADWELMTENPRMFERPNPLGPVFEYQYNSTLKLWELIEWD